MEKLQPLIVHRFWIFFGVALLLPTIGWWKGTGQLKAQIEVEEGKIKKAFGDIPKSNENQSWTVELEKIIADEQDRLDEATVRLKGTQQDLRRWPDEIADLMAGIPYRGEIKDTLPRKLYRPAYIDEIRGLAQIVDPFDAATNRGKVILEDGVIPHVPEDQWKFFIPKGEEMWNAQEDIWLLTELLLSIAAVNEGTKSLADATVRQIEKIELHGGDRPNANAAKPAAGGNPGSSLAVTRGRPGSGRPRSGAAALPGGGGGSVDFNVVDEFGSPNKAAAGGKQDDAKTTAPAGPGGSAGRAGAAEDRFVDEDPQLPFKTRGFKLILIMDHRKLPDLLIELTNSKWPVQIMRVHQADIHQDPGSMGRGGGRANLAGGSIQAPAAFEPAGAEPDAADRFPAVDAGGGLGARPRRGGTGNSAAAAMADPYLVRVAVSGLMTLYDPPEQTELAKVQAPAGQPAVVQPPIEATTEPPAADGNPATGTDSSATPPADPAGASDAPASQPGQSPSPAPAAPGTDDNTKPPATPGTTPPAKGAAEPADRSPK